MQNTKLVKKTVKVGNSAGVLLPAEWLNGVVEVKLVRQPTDYNSLMKQILEVLKERLLEVKAIAVAGSYARGDEDDKSDIDVIVITNNLNEHLRVGKLNILLVSEEGIKKELSKNPFPLLPMLKESRALINEELIKKYVDRGLNRKNLKWYIDTSKSAIRVVRKDIEISKELGENVSDASAYSLVLRLRTIYILDCIKKKQFWKKKDYLNFIKKISGSLDAYEGYSIVKEKKHRKKYNLKVEEALKLLEYLDKEIKKLEKWAKELKD